MRPYILGAVLRKEIAAGLASPRFQLSALLIVLLSAVASLTAAEEYQSRLDLWALLQRENDGTLVETHTFSALRPVALRTPEPLALFARGLDTRLGREASISVFSIPWQLRGDYRGNDFAVHRVELDLTTVVGVVLGFSALLLSFDAFTAERERGTGKLLAAAGATPAEVFVGKYLGLGLLLNLPLGLALASSLTLFRLRDLLPLDASTLPRIAGLVGAYEIYLSLVLLLGLTFSLVSARGSVALSRLMLLWLVFFLGVPYVAVNLGRDDVSLSRDELAVESRIAYLDAVAKGRLLLEERGDPKLAPVGHRRGFQLPDPEDRHVRYVRYGSARFYDALLPHVTREVERGRAAAIRNQAARQEVAGRRREREIWVMRASLASPPFVLERIAEALAGTSAADHDRFLEAARHYRERWVEALERIGALRSWQWFTDDRRETLRPWPTFFGWQPDDVTEGNIKLAVQLFSSPVPTTAWKAHEEHANRDPTRRVPPTVLPRFSYSGSGCGESLSRALPGLAWLAALHVGLLAGAGGWMRGGRDAFGVRA